MDYRSICQKHKNSYVVASVNERDERGFVKDWKVLSADAKNFIEAVETLKHYESLGVIGACIINTYEDGGDVFAEAASVARFMRLQFGMDLE